jgi:hypothetical protein
LWAVTPKEFILYHLPEFVGQNAISKTALIFLECQAVSRVPKNVLGKKMKTFINLYKVLKISGSIKF